jgi:hypothetical protein
MNVKLERKSDSPAPTNITCPWNTCVSNVHGWCHGVMKLVVGNVEYFDKNEECYFTADRLLCANFERRK